MEMRLRSTRSAGLIVGALLALVAAPHARLSAQTPGSGGAEAQEQASSQGKALAHAILVEEQEHDLARAAKLYRQIFDAAPKASELRTRAAWRLGRAMRLLGRKGDAEAWLSIAAKGQGDAAEQAAKLLGAPTSAEDAKVRQRARELIAAGKTGELQWLGEAAVPEILAAWRRSNQSGLAYAVCFVGGDRARRFLTNASSAELSSFAFAFSRRVHSSLVSVFGELVLDDDVDAKARRHILENSYRVFPWSFRMRAIAIADPSVRERAWVALTNAYPFASAEERRKGWGTIRAQLVNDLEHENAELRQAARKWIQMHAYRTPEARTFVVRRLAKFPRTFHLTFTSDGSVKVDRDVLPDVVAAAKALGAKDPERPDTRKAWLRSLVEMLVKDCDARDFDPLLALSEAGYFGGLASWIGVHFPKRERELLARLDGSSQIVALLPSGYFEETKPLASDLPILQRALEACRERDAYALPAILRLITRCRTADATSIVLRTGAKDVSTLWAAMAVLLESSNAAIIQRMHAPLCLELLRKFPIRSGAEKLALCRRAAAGLAARADATLAWDAITKMETPDRVALVGSMLRSVTRYGSRRDQVRVWTDVMAAPVHLHWAALYESVFYRHGRNWRTSVNWQGNGLVATPRKQPDYLSSRTIVAIMPVVLPALARWARSRNPVPAIAWKSDAAYSCARDMLITRGLFDIGGPANRARVREVEQALLESPSPALRRIGMRVLLHAPRQPAAATREPVFAALVSGDRELRKSAQEVLLRHFHPKAEDLRALVGAKPSAARDDTLRRILAAWKLRDASAVLPLLGQGDSDALQLNVCAYLESCVDPVAVPKLLEATRHSRQAVRQATRDALRAIRFYREQAEYWKR